MRVKGRRRCTECGCRWEYYETGEVTCPDCGSLRSVGIDDERTLHTDAPVELDLDSAIAAVESRSLSEVAAIAESAALQYLSRRGFINAGSLRPLDETAVAASQLRHVAGYVSNTITPPGDDVEAHFLALLDGAAEGTRPDDVPSPLRGPYGLAIVDVVGRYRKELTTWMEETDAQFEDLPLARLRDRQKRIEALDGEVPPSEADELLAATRTLGQYLRTGDAEHREELLDAVSAFE